MKKIIFLTLLSALIFSACKRKELVVEPDLVSNIEMPSKIDDPQTDYKKIDKVAADSTSLMRQISELKPMSDKHCTEYLRVLLNNKGIGKLNIDFINSSGFQDELQRVLIDKETTKSFTNEIEKFFDERHEEIGIFDLEQVCKKNKEVYSFFQKQGEPGWMVNLWQDNKFSTLLHDEYGNPASFYYDGGNMFFLPNAQGKNSLMYRFGYDLPDVYWTIDSLNPDTLLVTQIESCKLTFEYTNNPFWVNADKHTLRCDKQYKP